MNFPRHVAVMVLPALMVLQACGGAPPAPPELANARASYARASTGPASQLDPAEVHDAKVALDRAEAAFNDDPTAGPTLDYSVVADLKAQYAESRANILQSEKDKVAAAQALSAAQQAQLAAAQGQAKQFQQQASQYQQQVTLTQAQLDAERQRRADLEKKLKDAQDTLSKIASVKETDRGLVITMPGEVLFKTNESTLKPAAMVKLDQVAQSLSGQERKIVVEGHTDNQGGNSQFNQELSEKRAASVRDYLVSKGIPADLISSTGYGPSRPVADNTSIDGRATNRRVEIVVQPKAPSAQ